MGKVVVPDDVRDQVKPAIWQLKRVCDAACDQWQEVGDG